MRMSAVLAEHRASLGELPGWMPFNLLNETFCTPQMVNIALAWFSIMWDTHTHYGFRRRDGSEGSDGDSSGGALVITPGEASVVLAMLGSRNVTAGCLLPAGATNPLPIRPQASTTTDITVPDDVDGIAFSFRATFTNAHGTGSYSRAILRTPGGNHVVEVTTLRVGGTTVKLDGVSVFTASDTFNVWNTWYDLRIVNDDGTLRLYVNDAVVASKEWIASSVAPYLRLLSYVFTSTIGQNAIGSATAAGLAVRRGGVWVGEDFLGDSGRADFDGFASGWTPPPTYSHSLTSAGAVRGDVTVTDPYAPIIGDILYIPGSEGGAGITEETLGHIPPFAQTGVSELDGPTMDRLIDWLSYVEAKLYAHLTS